LKLKKQKFNHLAKKMMQKHQQTLDLSLQKTHKPVMMLEVEED
jgi:hypothetical protein